METSAADLEGQSVAAGCACGDRLGAVVNRARWGCLRGDANAGGTGRANPVGRRWSVPARPLMDFWYHGRSLDTPMHIGSLYKTPEQPSRQGHTMKDAVVRPRLCDTPQRGARRRRRPLVPAEPMNV